MEDPPTHPQQAQPSSQNSAVRVDQNQAPLHPPPAPRVRQFSSAVDDRRREDHVALGVRLRKTHHGLDGNFTGARNASALALFYFDVFRPPPRPEIILCNDHFVHRARPRKLTEGLLQQHNDAQFHLRARCCVHHHRRIAAHRCIGVRSLATGHTASLLKQIEVLGGPNRCSVRDKVPAAVPAATCRIRLLTHRG